MERVLLLPSKEKKIQKAVIELDKLNTQFKSEEEKYKKRKGELQDIIKGYADKHKYDEFGFNFGNSFLKVKPVIVKKILWDIPKLKKRLDKELVNEIVDKEYTINNMDGLINYLKSCGVNPKKFKQFIDVKEQVNNKKVDELNELGELDYDDLSGCYELQANFSYVKISNLEASDAEGGDK